jgi:HEPN domain-containing protein
MKKHHEQALVLLRKADEDLLVLRKWASDPDVAQSILGFHAQQAAEKTLKAILAERETRYPFTHYLIDLLDLLKVGGLAVPQELEALDMLSVFAVDYRYEDWLGASQRIDIEDALILLTRLREWAVSIIQA